MQATITFASSLVSSNKLTRDGLTRYLDAVQTLVTDPPTIGSIDMRGLAMTDLSTLVERLSLTKWRGKVHWNTLNLVRNDIANNASTGAGSYIIKLVCTELMHPTVASFRANQMSFSQVLLQGRE